MRDAQRAEFIIRAMTPEERALLARLPDVSGLPFETLARLALGGRFFGHGWTSLIEAYWGWAVRPGEWRLTALGKECQKLLAREGGAA